MNALSEVMARHAGIEPAWAHLSPAAQILCPAAFPLGVPGRKKGHEESLSEKKAIWEHRLKLSQWEQSVQLRAASMWDFPKHDTYSAWASSACKEDTEFGWHGICNNTMKFALLVRLFGSTPDGCRGWQSPQAGYCEVLIRLFEAFQRRIPASAKKRVRCWREEIWDVVAGSGLYSQTPLPFWRAMTGCIAIGSLPTITAWLKKASVKRKKGIFPYLRRYLEAVCVKYRKGNNFINLITHTLQMLKTQPNKETHCKYSQHNQTKKCETNTIHCLVVLWAFAVCFFICLCCEHLQHLLSNWWRCFLDLLVVFLFACVFWSCSALSCLGHHTFSRIGLCLFLYLRHFGKKHLFGFDYPVYSTKIIHFKTICM